MIKLPGLALAAALLGAVPQDPDPELAAAKARLASAMAATGLNCEATPSGLSYALQFADEGRQQRVLVSIAPNRVDGIVAHSIYTTVWVGASAPDEATMRKVFASVRKLGSFYLFKDNKGAWAIRFGVQFDATDLPAESHSGDAGAQALGDLIRFVSKAGEDMDRELNGDTDLK